MKTIKLSAKIAGGEWIDLGSHEIPDSTDPQDYMKNSISLSWAHDDTMTCIVPEWAFEVNLNDNRS